MSIWLLKSASLQPRTSPAKFALTLCVAIPEVSAPAKSALELGKENASFRVFVRIRPLLQREEEAQAQDCITVEDVDFPRKPPPQRITVSDPRLEGVDSEMFAHHVKRGTYVFDRVFEPAEQDEVLLLGIN